MESIRQNAKITRNYSLDLLKFIASFLIVCIHFKFSGEAGKVVTIISRFAVPLFFMVSGYFSFGDDHEKIKDKIIHIAKIYLFAVVLYFCFNVLVMVFEGQYKEAVWYVSTYFRISYTFKTILFNESLTAMHLWFLNSLVYTYVIRYVVVKARIREGAIYVFAGALLVLNLVLGIGLSAFGLEKPGFLLQIYSLRNFIFLGFPFFTLGYFIKKKETAVLNLMSGKFIVLFIVLSIIDTVVVWKIDWMQELYLGSVIMAFALFVLGLKLKDKQYHSNLIELFKTTTGVYIIHVMVGDILDMTVLSNMQFYLYLKPVVIFALSVLITMLANCVIRRIKKIKAN